MIHKGRDIRSWTIVRQEGIRNYIDESSYSQENGTGSPLYAPQPLAHGSLVMSSQWKTLTLEGPPSSGDLQESRKQPALEIRWTAV